MIDRTHARPRVRQCQLLELARAPAYSQATPVSPDEVALMRRIDARHVAHPFGGARMLRKMLKRAGASKFRPCLHPDETEGYPRSVSQPQPQQAASGASGVSRPGTRSDDHPFPSRRGSRQRLLSRCNEDSSICSPR